MLSVITTLSLMTVVYSLGFHLDLFDFVWLTINSFFSGSFMISNRRSIEIFCWPFISFYTSIKYMRSSLVNAISEILMCLYVIGFATKKKKNQNSMYIIYYYVYYSVLYYIVFSGGFRKKATQGIFFTLRRNKINHCLFINNYLYFFF